MNSPLLRWLLDVDLIPAGADGLALAWERPWPLWVWSALAIVAALFAVWSYSKLVGRPAGRWVLACVRAAIILLALAFISGPMLQLPRETVEQDWLLVLADRSQSMTIADAPPDVSAQLSLARRKLSASTCPT